jgi:hypothetical protein
VDPGSGIGFFRIPALGSQFQTHIFGSLVTNFLVKSSIILRKLAEIFFFSISKNKIIFNFVKFMATKKVLKINFFSPLSFVAVFGSGIWDLKSGIRDKHYGSATLL